MKFRFEFFVLIILFLSGCNEVTLKSSKSASSITIDGNPEDWKNANFTALNNSPIKLSTLHNSDYIYIAGFISDKNISKMAAANGITISISPSGSSDKDLSFTLNTRGHRAAGYNEGGFFSLLSESQKKQFRKNIDSLNSGIIVSDNVKHTFVNFLDGVNDFFKGKISSNKDSLFFEIQIPKQLGKYFPSYIELNNNSLFCIESGRGFRNTANEMRGNQSRMEMQGRTGGERNFMGQHNNEKPELSEFKEIWLKIESVENE